MADLGNRVEEWRGSAENEAASRVASATDKVARFSKAIGGLLGSALAAGVSLGVLSADSKLAVAVTALAAVVGVVVAPANREKQSVKHSV